MRVFRGSNISGVLLAACLLANAAGCATWKTAAMPPCLAQRLCPADRVSVAQRDRLDHGYVVILPGVCGATYVDERIRRGLQMAGADAAIEVYDWTDGSGNRTHNLRAEADNRAQAANVAQRIAAYQDLCPGRPVHLVGYSGGAAVAVFVLEALPPGRRVTSVTLLGATLSPDYDLSLAMGHIERPIESYRSSLDVGALVCSTTLLGTMDGAHTWSAGAVGFTTPERLTAPERDAYRAALVEHPHDWRMLEVGHIGGHYGWASPWFVSRWIAPEIVGTSSARHDVALARQGWTR